MTPVAESLARWAAHMRPSAADLELSDRALDAVAVALAGRNCRVVGLAAGLPDGPRWAVAAHVLDYDDLHMPSTTHVPCSPVFGR